LIRHSERPRLSHAPRDRSLPDVEFPGSSERNVSQRLMALRSFLTGSKFAVGRGEA